MHQYTIGNQRKYNSILFIKPIYKFRLTLQPKIVLHFPLKIVFATNEKYISIQPNASHPPYA